MYHAKRIALGAAVAAAAAIAVPGVASAASTCTFGPGGPGGTTPTVTVNDSGGLDFTRVVRQGQFIGIRDGVGPFEFCTGATGVATVTNTDFINFRVAGSNGGGSRPAIIDQSAGALAPGATFESDGNSEIEVQVDGPTNTDLVVLGTTGNDTMRATSSGGVMIGNDLDRDIRHRNTPAIQLSGLGGNDFLSGRGGGSFLAADRQLFIFGGIGTDTLVDGLAGGDNLDGGADDDTLFTVDNNASDRSVGSTGFDRATIDNGEFVEAEQVTKASVGRLKLSPKTVKAQADGIAHVQMSWTHPKNWKQLRKVALRLADGGEVLGSVVMRPKSGRLAGKLVAEGSTLSHHGKTVTAKLALRLPASLAGKSLRLEVEATDRDGNSQLEPDAGLIDVR
jgi:hypothetical protein